MAENLLLRANQPFAQTRPVGASAPPPEHTRVMFVCTGNVCRSAYAERALATALAEGPAAGRVTVTSMGTQPNQALGVPRTLQRLGAQEGVVGLETHRPRALVPHELGQAHLILTATAEHMDRVLHDAPQCMMRTFTMLEFAQLVVLLDSQEPGWLEPGMGVPAMARAAARHRSKVHAADGRLDLPDPFGKAEEDYRQMVDRVHPVLDRIRRTIERAVGPAESRPTG